MTPKQLDSTIRYTISEMERRIMSNYDVYTSGEFDEPYNDIEDLRALGYAVLERQGIANYPMKTNDVDRMISIAYDNLGVGR